MKQGPDSMKPLKIAMVIDSYDGGKNGAAISTRRFVELLRKEHEVFIISTGDPAPGKIVMPSFYAPIWRKIMKRMNVHLAIPSYRKLHKAIRDMDIVHVQFPFLLGMRSVRIANKLKIPVISTFHIQAEHLAMNAGIHSGAFIRICYRIWLKHLYNRSSIVICPSKFARDELKHYGLTAKTMIISNGIPPLFRPLSVLRNPSYSDKFILLSVGRFAPEKQQEIILKAIAISKYRNKLQLIMVGEGPMKEKLEEIGRDLPNQPVFLTLSQEELVTYYNMADLFVHAATIEVECMTALEAMGCGLPLLIGESSKSATGQFALDDRSLFPSSDVKVLSEKIDYWVEHPEELKEARQLYYDYSQRYRIEYSYEKLAGIYRDIGNGGLDETRTRDLPECSGQAS